MMRAISMIFAAGLLLPGLSQAAGLSYSYIEGGYGETEIDSSDVEADGDGYRVSGSIAIGPTYHAVAEYSTADLEVSNFNINADVDTISIGFGYNRPISPRADVIGRILYVESDFSIDSPFFNADGDDSGLGFQMRVRGEARERLEVEGGIDYVDVGDDETTLVLEGRYFLIPALALGAGIEIGDDTTSYGVTLRFNFGAPTARR